MCYLLPTSAGRLTRSLHSPPQGQPTHRCASNAQNLALHSCIFWCRKPKASSALSCTPYGVLMRASPFAKEHKSRASVHGQLPHQMSRRRAAHAPATKKTRSQSLDALLISMFLRFTTSLAVGRRARSGAAALVGGRGAAAIGRAACVACLPCSQHRRKVRLRMCSQRSAVLTTCARLTVSVHRWRVCIHRASKTGTGAQYYRPTYRTRAAGAARRGRYGCTGRCVVVYV